MMDFIDPADATRQGFVWFRGWQGPYESLDSLLSKLCVFNRMESKDLEKLLLKPKTPQAATWQDVVSRAFFRESPPLLSAKHGSQPHHLLWSGLGVESTFSHCRDCMDMAYYPSFFRYEGVVSCPVHEAPLVQKCRHCKTTLLNESQERNIFQCAHCLRPLGRPLKAERGPIDANFIERADKAWAPFARWLYTSSRTDVVSRRAWGTVPLSVRNAYHPCSPASSILSPKAVVQKLVVPHEGPPHLPGYVKPIPLRTDMLAYAEHLRLPHLVPIYKAIERHIRKQINRHHKYCLQKHFPICGPWDIGKSCECQVVRAYLKWLARCEYFPNRTRSRARSEQGVVFRDRIGRLFIDEDWSGRMWGHTILGVFLNELATLWREFEFAFHLSQEGPEPERVEYKRRDYLDNRFRLPDGLESYCILSKDTSELLVFEPNEVFSRSIQTRGRYCLSRTAVRRIQAEWAAQYAAAVEALWKPDPRQLQLFQ